MKKIFFLFFMMSLSVVLHADQDTGVLVDIPTRNQETEQLLAMDSTSSRVNQLERRVNDLERELRYSRESIRNLDREVQDLRRSVNSR